MRTKVGRRRAGIIAAVVAASMLFTACGASGGEPGDDAAGGRGDTLTVGITRAPAGLDAGSGSRAGITNNYLRPAYQPLIDIDEEGELAPSLATEWEWLDDTNTNLKLTLRKDAKFSDGSPVTAESVVAYWKYALQTAYSRYWLGGAGFETPDATTLLVHLKEDEPRPSLPWAFTPAFSALSWITNPKALEDPEKLKVETAGAGPYVLDADATITNSSYVYTPNEHFYDKSQIHWNKIVVKVMPEEQTRLAALRTGQLDVAMGALRQMDAAEEAGLQVVSGPGAARPVILGDLEGKTVPALKDVRVRRAMMHAVDWEKVGKGIFGEHVVANQQLFVKGSQGYLSELVDAYPYDLEKARSLMAEAGYPDGFDAGQMLVGPVENNPEIAQVLQAAWAKIGVRVQPLVLDPSMWGTKLQSRVWPVNLFSSIIAPVGPTITAVLDPDVKWLEDSDFTGLYSLISKAQHTPADTPESEEAWQEVNRYVVDNVLLMTGLMPTGSWFARPDIGGVVMNPPAQTSITRWREK